MIYKGVMFMYCKVTYKEGITETIPSNKLEEYKNKYNIIDVVYLNGEINENQI